MIKEIENKMTFDNLWNTFYIRTFEHFSRTYKKEELQTYLRQSPGKLRKNETELGIVFENKFYRTNMLLTSEEVLKNMSLYYNNYNIYGDIFDEDNLFFLTEDGFISFKIVSGIIRISCLEDFFKSVPRLEKSQFDCAESNIETFKPKTICFVDDKVGIISCDGETFLEKEEIDFNLDENFIYILGALNFYKIEKERIKNV